MHAPSHGSFSYSQYQHRTLTRIAEQEPHAEGEGELDVSIWQVPVLRQSSVMAFALKPQLARARALGRSRQRQQRRGIAEAHVTERADYLVIGSGVAGLVAALDLSEHGTVAVVSKAGISESSTNWAKGGICGALSSDDSIAHHVSDTHAAGAGLCEHVSVQRVCANGPAAIRHLLSIGTRFDTDPDGGELHMHKEGGHSHARVAHTADATGAEIERALVNRVRNRSTITLLERYFARDLLVTHESEGTRRCVGAEVQRHTPGSEPMDIHTSSVIIATGGCGQVYPVTTNPHVATGDGIAMSVRAGATIANMEFVQFHPTALYDPEESRGTGSASLLTEAVRGAGALLRNSKGERFMHQYDERAELAPRDIVARSIDAECKRLNDECASLDLSGIGRDKLEQHFPNVLQLALDRGYDPEHGALPVAPAAHYMCGGVRTDAQGETAVKGLLACGEVAYTGLHGANRLASNSLLEGVVYGRAAAKRAIEIAECDGGSPPQGDVPADIDQSVSSEHANGKTSADILRDLHTTSREDAGIVRSNSSMQRGITEAREVLKQARLLSARSGKGGTEELEVVNCATVALLILHCAALRKESRGLHFNTDYPQEDESMRAPTIVDDPLSLLSSADSSLCERSAKAE